MRVTQRLINIIVAPLAKHQRIIGSTAVYFYLAYLICLVVRTRY